MEQRFQWRYVSPAWIIVSRAHNVQTSRCSIHTPNSVCTRLLQEHFNLVCSKLQFNSSLNTRLLSLVCFLPDGHLMMCPPLIGQPDPMKPSDWLLATDPQCSWSLDLMSALSAPEDVKLVQISSSSYQEHRHERSHKNGTGAILREIEHRAHVPANVAPWVIWIWWPEQVFGVQSSFGDKFYEESTTMATAQPTLTSSKNHLLIVAKLCWIFIIS